MGLSLLLTNDDGYQAPGLKALREELAKQHKLTVIAPDRERSGSSAALTLGSPLKINKHEEGVYSVAGTPADCAHLAFRHFMNDLPDLVVSGINRGPNLGDDTLFSGTVGAANVASLEGLPAIAVSMGDFGEPMNYATAAVVVAKLIQKLDLQCRSLRGKVLNINVPNVAYDDLKGVRQTRLARRYYPRHFDPDRENPDDHLWYGRGDVSHDELPDSDATAIDEGYVSLCMLSPHLLDNESFPNGLKKEFFHGVLDS